MFVSTSSTVLFLLFLLEEKIYIILSLKGHALAEKAGARMDFSYVPGHLGEF